MWIFCLLVLPGPGGAQGADGEPGPREFMVADAGELYAAVDAAASRADVLIRLGPGDFHLTAFDYVDPTCGNCEDPHQPLPATLGLRISGQRVRLVGSGRDRTRIHTHAGYGLLFEDCADCRMEGLTITGGERDTSGRATDAAIVVRRSDLAVHNCRIADNRGDSAGVAHTVVGIMGICGREDSRLTVTDCRIERNSWDGIALYRDAWARIENCVIDGVESGRGGPARGGRGVGIGVTWNARAEIRGNLVRRYWKGIGLFVDAEATVEENVVEQMRTWGITLWDAGRGTPYGEIAWNAVSTTGACGIAVTRGRTGGRPGSRVVDNALVATGLNPAYDSDDTYCFQQALARHAVTEEMEIARNLRCANREPGDRPGRDDLSEADFGRRAAPLLARLGAYSAARESDFYAKYAAAGARGSLPPPSWRPGPDARHAGGSLLSDIGHICSAPLRISGRSALWLAGIAAVGGLLYAYDAEIHAALDRNRDHALYQPFRRVGEAIEPVGHMGKTNRYYFGALAVGYLIRSRTLTTLAAQILEGHFIAGGGKNLAVAAVGRRRPHEGRGARAFDRGEGTSFPSGHAINIVQLADILAFHIPWLPARIACYGLATAVCFQRVTDDAHWPSDVYAAAIWGHGIARAILARHHPGGVRLWPLVNAPGGGLGIAVSVDL